MPEWLKHALEALKQPARYFLPVLFASGFALFAPLALLKDLGIDQWRAENNSYLGLVLVLAAAVVACEYGIAFARWLVDKYHVFLAKRAAIARLKRLSTEEKAFLARYLKEESRTQYLAFDDGVAAGLAKADIVYAAVSQGDIYSFPFNITDWAWDYLQEHPDVLGSAEIRKKSTARQQL